jgi:hypothetical protein
LTAKVSDVLVLFMHDAVEMAERHGRMLGRLSELGMSLAEGVHAQAAIAMEAADPKAVADLSLTFHRISRSVRQSIALEARLVRDLARAEREAAAEAEHKRTAILRDPVAMVRRKAAVQEAIEKIIWTEREGEAAEELLDRLETRLAPGSVDDDICLEPLETHIARLCADLGLPPPFPPLHGEGGRDAVAPGGEVSAKHDPP